MGERAYLLAVVGCVGHAHQVLVGPAVQVGVLPADDAVARVAGLALAAVHGVAVVAQVVALGVAVAVVGPVRARVAGFAHLRGQHPDVSAEPSGVSRYGRNKKNPGPCQLRTDGLQGEGPGSLLSFSPATPPPRGCAGYGVTPLYVFFLKLLSTTPHKLLQSSIATLMDSPAAAAGLTTTDSLVLVLKAGLCVHASRFFVKVMQ